MQPKRVCAACGVQGDLHRHHLVPRAYGGEHFPTVMLCPDCHGQVHNRPFPVNHSELTKAGMRRARERGVLMGPRANLTQEHRALVRERHVSGMSIRANARASGISRVSVWRITRNVSLDDAAVSS